MTINKTIDFNDSKLQCIIDGLKVTITKESSVSSPIGKMNRITINQTAESLAGTSFVIMTSDDIYQVCYIIDGNYDSLESDKCIVVDITEEMSITDLLNVTAVALQSVNLFNIGRYTHDTLNISMLDDTKTLEISDDTSKLGFAIDIILGDPKITSEVIYDDCPVPTARSISDINITENNMVAVTCMVNVNVPNYQFGKQIGVTSSVIESVKTINTLKL